jgi:hypothetical protein
MRFHQTAGSKAQIQPMQVELQAMAVQWRHLRQHASLMSDSLCAATSVAITMAACTPSGVANTAATVIATAQEPTAKR